MDNFEQIMKDRPHLVILGAGASVATIPNGDAFGKKISVMDGFLEKLSLTSIIKKANLKTNSNNLEDIYSELFDNTKHDRIRYEFENTIYDYFLQYQLPNTPTIYDYLLLSLRKKDCVSTFNWDPLLLQAYLRVKEITTNLPELLFLHGNVMMGICYTDRLRGIYGNKCPSCGNSFEKDKLLFPVKNKNYAQNLSIKDYWNALHHYFKRSYRLTIFGYSAPKTDQEAMDLFQNAWGTPNERDFEQFEIIDIQSQTELIHKWKPFIHSHHYDIHTSFFDSSIAQFPRRSNEALFDMTMKNQWIGSVDKLLPNMSFQDLRNFFSPLLEEENNSNGILNLTYSG